MRPSSLSEITIPPVNIGLTIIRKLEIDLVHINHGLDSKTKNYRAKARSNFSEIEVANVFNSLDGFFLNPTGKKDDYLYFACKVKYLRKYHMLVFCVSKKSIQVAGVISLYKIRK